MVVSWIAKTPRARTRVVRANLNGGELDEEPFLRDDWQECDRDIKEDIKQKGAQFPDRPKWRRAGARACHRCIRGGGSKPGPT